ncbi:hypothetical protein CHH55_18390 [Niallia circulans]|jgi:hypothetical protein|uniref:Uncharacterized protein n=1 Tax=Niallia circulans TaxID=1397 RepID=A0A0J1LE11_NIACI|nr:hypothetical protein [Niallia circulans]KLV27150.1 hypothetical protein ABW02_06375 [Niallia circulans]PAD24578.1 hypothetical protein CHH62_15955 [Niallia circulans]PAD86513.1 hypothetical protein CHH55_18390 [Niallia circulans]
MFLKNFVYSFVVYPVIFFTVFLLYGIFDDRPYHSTPSEVAIILCIYYFFLSVYHGIIKKWTKKENES